MTDPINAALDRLQEYAAAHPEHDTDELVARARAELAEPADAPTTVAEGPSDEEIMELMPQQMREDLAAAARAIAEQAGTDSRRAMGAMRIILNRHAVDLALAVLARWGQPAAPPAEGEVAEIAVFLRDCADDHYAQGRRQFTRAAELLDEFVYHTDWSDGEELKARARTALAEPVAEPPAVAKRPSDEELGLIYHDCCRGCEFMDQVGFEDAARAVLARWGQPPAPPAEGEVAELARWLRLRNPIDMEGEPDDCTYFMLTRTAELLERHAAMENLAADAVSGLRYIEQSAGRLYGVGWDRVFDAAATLQPAHALPPPQGGEVQP